MEKKQKRETASVRVDRKLRHALKKLAVEEDTTIGKLIEKLLRGNKGNDLPVIQW